MMDLDTVPLLLVMAARLAVPLIIPLFPFPGTLAAIALDMEDKVVFEMAAADQIADYQEYDKALDVYYLSIAYRSTLRNWPRGAAFAIGRALWYYRLVGVALFESVGARWLLLLFPNTFEYYFLTLEGIKVAGNPFVLSRARLAALAASIWIFVKLPQEWFVHVAEGSLSDVLVDRVLGVPAGASAALRLAVAALLLAVAASMILLPLAFWRRLPPADWEPTFSADAQARRLGRRAPQVPAAPRARFDGAFVEKALLVSLVTVIFSRILPGYRNPVQLAVGTTAVIAAATLISLYLARRGVAWRSAGVEFLALSATIVGIGGVVRLLLATPRSTTPPGAFLFLSLLMALIIVLFDRFGRVAERHRETSSSAEPPP